MRIWSVHPKYLDQKGLVALWREGLLAQSCLIGKSKGYSNHSQLTRFKRSAHPAAAISYYLEIVFEEAEYSRSYSFNSDKIIQTVDCAPVIPVTRGQVEYEFRHLANKLLLRDPDRVSSIPMFFTQKDIHPLFKLVDGPIESWEVI